MVMTSNDGQEYSVILETENGNDAELIFKIKGVPFIKMIPFSSGFENFVQELSKKIFCNYTYVKFIVDCLSSNPADKLLSLQWEIFKKFTRTDLAKHQKDFLRSMLCWRDQILNPGLCSSIRTTYNSIAWSYGEVAVLRGI